MVHNALAYQLAHSAQKLAVRKRKRKDRRQMLRDPLAQQKPASNNPLSGRQLLGRQAEDVAAQCINDAGLTLLARNLHCKAGEIDLVAADGLCLVFIEVRLRSSAHYGGACASVNRRKQQRLILAAQYFLPRLSRLYFQGRLPVCRFDVICIEPSGLVWIKQAFDVS